MKMPTFIMMDDFYDDPKAVVELANSLQFTKAPQTNFPGERSDFLHVCALGVYTEFLRKFKAQFAHLHPSCNWEINTQFQRIPALDRAELNEGWVHADISEHVAGVIYLNEEPILDAGTSLVNARGGYRNYGPNSNIRFRNAYYGGRNGVTEDAYVKAKAIHNGRFDDSLVVKNRFNRMIAYDASCPHKQSSFGAPGHMRLTQVFFVKFL